MATMLMLGFFALMGFIMPLPQMWLGRQPKGWVQTMLSTPLSASSSISAVSSQPSPIFTPMLMVPWTRSMVWVKRVGGEKRPWAFMMSIMSCSLPSR